MWRTPRARRPNWIIASASPPRIRAGAALGVAGLALDLYDAAQTRREAQHLRAQGNDTAADSHLIHFGTRTVGGAAGAGMGFAAGAAAGVQTGPGLLFTGAIGSAVGAFAGEKLADEWDERRIYRQTDREGRTWTFDPDRPGLGWHRKAAIDDRDDGLDNARAGIVRAAPALADELDYKATAVSLELKLGAPSVPRDPFAQPAADGDTPSSRPSPWVRDADTGQWTRVVYGPFVERGMTPRQTETATPERAAELDRQAAAVVLENARLAPAALAARYEDAYLRHGWAAHGPMPEAVSRARSDFDTLLGSDGNRYRRGEDGEWRHDGLLSDRIARGNLKHELEATREVLQATLPPRQAHAPLSAAAVPRSEDEAVRDALRGAYAHAGVAVDEKALSASPMASCGSSRSCVPRTSRGRGRLRRRRPCANPRHRRRRPSLRRRCRATCAIRCIPATPRIASRSATCIAWKRATASRPARTARAWRRRWRWRSSARGCACSGSIWTARAGRCSPSNADRIRSSPSAACRSTPATP